METQNSIFSKNETSHPVHPQDLRQANNTINEIFKYIERENNFKDRAAEIRYETDRKRSKRSLVVICLYLFFLGALVLCSDSNVTIVLSMVLACVGAILFAKYRNSKRYPKNVTFYENKAAENRAIADKIAQENEAVLSILPSQYRYPLASNYIVELFANGRATTLPEALDKYEEQLHRWKMERAMQQELALQAAQLQILSNIYEWI